jgi:integrase/recombinase XerD
MANIKVKQKVSIRKKQASNNRASLFLDWHDGNGKRTKEYLGLFLIDEPSNLFDRQNNKEILIKAEFVRSEREQQLFKGEVDEVKDLKKNKNKDFTAYFEAYIKDYAKKDKRVMQGVFLHFKEFAPKYITAKEIDETFCIKFKEYLSKKLNGESPQTYFSRFKKMLKQATREKLFKSFPAEDVKNEKPDSSISIAKDVLTIEEVQVLSNAYCGNAEVKRAFLFSCNTGLRFVDIKTLQWKNIENELMTIEQSKTKDKAQDGGRVEVVLNSTAQSLLGTPPLDKESYVFKLPSHNGTMKSLENWKTKAGIEKHITFHCARHTFGTLLSYYNTDIMTISKLLGHTSLKHTAKYVRISNEMKERAVNAIPTINLAPLQP